MARDRNKYSTAAIIADAVGLAHFFVANLLIIYGQLTDGFANLSAKWGGIAFVYRYLDAPMFFVISPLIGTTKFDDLQTVMLAQMIIVASSVLYGLIVYFFCKLLSALAV